MRYRELTEAPIVDYQVVGQDTNSFDKPDMKLIRSDKAKARMIRVFENTPHRFSVIFAPDPNIEHDDQEVGDALERVSAGIHDEYILSNWMKVTGETGVIKIIMLGNISPVNKMPMTPWTLAHKIGHSFQDDTSGVSKEILDQIDVVDQLTGSNPKYGMFQPNRTRKNIMKGLTMRSARYDKDKLSPFEVFPEIIAQYLITGKVTIRDDEEKSRELTSEIYKLFQMIDGKVLVEV